jgi:aldose 1-epimerase
MKNFNVYERFLRCLSLSILVASFPFLATEVDGQPGAPAPPLQIGGEAPVALHRVATNHGMKPEFSSLTFLPGLGMNIFQITASTPGKGETCLLTSPSLEELARRLNGDGERSAGLGAGFGTAFLIPYPNRIFG